MIHIQRVESECSVYTRRKGRHCHRSQIEHSIFTQGPVILKQNNAIIWYACRVEVLFDNSVLSSIPQDYHHPSLRRPRLDPKLLVILDTQTIYLYYTILYYTYKLPLSNIHTILYYSPIINQKTESEGHCSMYRHIVICS